MCDEKRVGGRLASSLYINKQFPDQTRIISSHCAMLGVHGFVMVQWRTEWNITEIHQLFLVSCFLVFLDFDLGSLFSVS